VSPEAERNRRVAMARLRERARRISLIRRSVFAAATATFVLAWGLALNDQLAHGTKTSPAGTTAGRSQGSSSSASTSSGDDGLQAAEDSGVVVTPAPTTVAPVTPTPAPAPLTTSQS